ncbi:E3 ubiquitin-protein ligase RNF212B-like isoform X2 [Tubulanus polymorphus]|uniref:E3 ubiquitin-protein ligase RNF212B-like isoform X2 n=1 Tax=Tubulanus polymorphus TaxID=672921 RepID=UPI003DA36EDB
MADWVHCNLCYRQPDGLKFFLTSCGHVFCDDCLQNGEKNEKCKICGNRCTSTPLISNKMRPEVEIFFSDPLYLLKKNYKQIVQVIEFQRNHRLRLYSHRKQLLSRQNTIMDKVKGFQKAGEQIQKLEKEVLLLRQENSYLKKAIAGGRGGSPSNTRSSPQINNIASRLMSQSSQITSSQQNMQISSHRISLRTPPYHGKRGIIPGTPSPVYHGKYPASSPYMFDLKLKEVKTPNPYDPETPRVRQVLYSPMQTSPHHLKGFVK